MRCAVVFGVTLRLLVINISSSSPTINTAAYYQRCVTLTLARRWPWSTGDGVYTVFAPVDEIVIRRSRSEITGRYPTCLLFPSWSRELQLSMQLVVYLEVDEHVKIAVSPYRKHHSTETAVLRVLSDILNAMDNQQVTVLA